MANVFLSANENFTLASGATVFGSNGTEKVIVNVGVNPVVTDANIERVDLPGTTGSFTYQQVGNQLKVFSGTTLVLTTTVQDDANGTQVVGTNGAVEVKIGTGGVMTLGGAQVPTTAPGAVTPTTIDTTITSGSNVAPPTPTLSFAATAVSLVEGNSGTTNMEFTVNLSPAQTGTVTVNYATANGTATAGSDYTATTGTLTFAATETSKKITVPIIGDTQVEPNETFTVTLSGAVGATISATAGVATGTITNDDQNQAPTIAVTPTSFGAQVAQTVAMNVDFTVADADTGVLTVTITPANGQVNLPNIAGVTDGGRVTLGPNQVLGTNYPSLTVTGTIANLNAALDKLNYQTGLTSAGTDTITVSVSDGVAAAVTTTLTANVGGQLTALTAGNDNRTGSAGDDLLPGTEATLTAGDVIDLGLGSGDTLQLTLGAALVVGASFMNTPIKGTEKLLILDTAVAAGFSTTVDGDNFNGELSSVTYRYDDPATPATAATADAHAYTNLKQGATVNIEVTDAADLANVFTGVTVGIKNAALAGNNSDTANVNFVGTAQVGLNNDNVFAVTTLTTTDVETTTLDTGTTGLDNANGFRIGNWTGTGTAVVKGATLLNIGDLGGTLNTVNGTGMSAALIVGASTEAGSVALTGGAGADRLLSGGAADNLTGNDGNDFLYAGNGTDVLSGGVGDDVLVGWDATAPAADAMTGGAGKDVFFASQVTNTAVPIVDTITDFDFSADTIAGLANAVTTFKPTQDLSSALTLVAAAGAALGGGTGQIGATQAGTFTWGGNTYLLINPNAGTTFDATDTLIKVTGATNIPTTVGGAATTALTAAGFTLTGSFGPDAIVGSLGADIITGGEGADNLTGGDGSDTINLTIDGAVDTVRFTGTALTSAALLEDTGLVDTVTNFLSAAGSDVLGFGSTFLLTGFTSGSFSALASNQVVSGSNGSADGFINTVSNLSVSGEADFLTAFGSTYGAAASQEGIFIVNGAAGSAFAGDTLIFYVNDSLDGTATEVNDDDVTLIGVLDTFAVTAGTELVAANFTGPFAS